MRYYRFMSYAEFEKILKGETLSNQSQWRSVSSIDLEDNSSGFCFLREQVVSSRGYLANPIECYMSMSGIVCDDVLVCFEKLDEVKMKESFGTYAPLDGGWGESEYLDEYSILSYSKETFIPVGFYTDIRQDYKSFEEDFNPIKINLNKNNADLKMLLIYGNLDLDYIEERIDEFDEECFRLCAAYQKLDDDFIRKYSDSFNIDTWYELLVKQKVPEDIMISNFDKFNDFNLLTALLQSRNLTDNVFEKIVKEYSYIFEPDEYENYHYYINSEGFSDDFILKHLNGFSCATYNHQNISNGGYVDIYLDPSLEERCKDIFLNANEDFIREIWARGSKDDEYSEYCFDFFKNFLENPNCKKVFFEKFYEALEYGREYDNYLLLHYYSLLSPNEIINDNFILDNPGFLNSLVFGDAYDYSFLANNYNELPDYAKEVIISKYPSSISNYIELCVNEEKMFNIGALYSSYFKNKDFTIEQVFDKVLEDIFNTRNMNYEYLQDLVMYNCKNFILNGTMFDSFRYKDIDEKDLFIKYLYLSDNKTLDFIFEKNFIEQNKYVLGNFGEDVWQKIYEHSISKNLESSFVAKNLSKFFKLAKSDEEREEFFKLALPTMREIFEEDKRLDYISDYNINKNPLYKKLLIKYSLIEEDRRGLLKADDNILNPKSSKFIGADKIYKDIPHLKRDKEQDTLFLKLQIFDRACEYGVYPTKEQLNILLKDFEEHKDFFNIEVTHRFRNILKVPNLDTSFVLEEFKSDDDLNYRDVIRVMEYLSPKFIDKHFETFKELLFDAPLAMSKVDKISFEEDTIIRHFDFFEEKGIIRDVLSKIEDKEAFIKKCPQAERQILFELEKDRRIISNEEERTFYKNICLESINKYLNSSIEETFNLKIANEDFIYENFNVKKGMCYGMLDDGRLVVVNDEFEKNGKLTFYIKENDTWVKNETDIETSNFYIDGTFSLLDKLGINANETIIENGVVSFVINDDLISFNGYEFKMKEQDFNLSMFFEDSKNIYFRIEGSSDILIYGNDDSSKNIIIKDFFNNSKLDLDNSNFSIAIVNEILKVNDKKEVRNLLENIRNNGTCEEILNIIKDSDSDYIDNDLKNEIEIDLN